MGSGIAWRGGTRIQSLILRTPSPELCHPFVHATSTPGWQRDFLSRVSTDWFGDGLKGIGEKDYELTSVLSGKEYHDKLEMPSMGRTGGNNRQYICHIFAVLGPSHFCGSHMIPAAGTIIATTSLLYISFLPHGGACFFSTRIQVSALLSDIRQVTAPLWASLLHQWNIAEYNT